MPAKTVHCSICGQAVTGYDFKERMDKLRKHRKQKHPGAHKKSVKKALKTRKQLVANPQVLSFRDIKVPGTVRVLKRRDAEDFVELAVTVPGHYREAVMPSLKFGGFTDEKRGKWVLRTNKFNIFVYV